jgi:hypothetical protein
LRKGHVAVCRVSADGLPLLEAKLPRGARKHEVLLSAMLLHNDGLQCERHVEGMLGVPRMSGRGLETHRLEQFDAGDLERRSPTLKQIPSRVLVHIVKTKGGMPRIHSTAMA